MSMLPGKIARVPRDERQMPDGSMRDQKRCRCGLSFTTLLLNPEEEANRSQLHHSYKHHSHGSSTSHKDFRHNDEPLPPQFSRTAASASIPLHRCEVHRLIGQLPQPYRNAQWAPIFDTKVDGYSLNHFYRSLHEYQSARPHVKAAIGFLEVLTREQWEAAAEVAERPDQHQIATNEVRRQHVPLFEKSRPKPQASQGTGSVLTSPVSRGLAATCRSTVLERATNLALYGSPNRQVAKFSVSSPQPSVQRKGPPTIHQLSSPTVVGVFAPIMPSLDHGPHRFFGARETSVFAFTDVQDGVKNSSATGNVPRHFRYHKWSGKNEEFLICSPHFLGIGGGEDGAALYIDEEIQFGTSTASCPTFGLSEAGNAPQVSLAALKMSAAKTTPTSRGNSPSAASPSSAFAPSLFGTPVESLNHSEFFIVRMQWFAIDDSRFVDLCGHHHQHSTTKGQTDALGNSIGARRESTVPSLIKLIDSNETKPVTKEVEAYSVSPSVMAAICADLGMKAQDNSDDGDLLECGCGAVGPTVFHQCKSL